MNDKVLNHKQNNYLASVYFEKEAVGISLLDVSTGEFMVAEGPADQVEMILQNLSPSEVIVCKPQRDKFIQRFGEKYYLYTLDDWMYQFDFGNDKLLAHFGTKSLKGFGIEKHRLAITASGAVLQYLEQSHHTLIGHINNISRIESEQYVARQVHYP